MSRGIRAKAIEQDCSKNWVKQPGDRMRPRSLRPSQEEGSEDSK